MTACTWVSSKWPSEAFGSRAVARCYVGAVGEEDILEADDAELIEACARHLAAVVPLPEAPEHAAVVRWPSSMPQYELGHRERVARIRQALPAGIFVVGQPYDGVGVPDCVRGAGETAEQVAAYLADAADARGDGSMSDTVYALYAVFMGSDDLREELADPDDRRDAVQEVENLYKSWEGTITVRGTYSTVGFRADADLMLWLVRSDAAGRAARPRRVPPDDDRPAHRPHVDVHGRRQAGGVHGRPRARVREGRRRRRPSCACTRSSARPSGTCCRATSAASCCASTGVAGREFPEVLANTTSDFGLGDWEWILAFEAEKARLARRRDPAAARNEGAALHEGRGPVHHGDPQARRRGDRRPDLTASSSTSARRVAAWSGT